MKHLKMLGLAAMAVMALAAWGASTASATELYSGSTTQGVGTKIAADLTAGSTATLSTTDEKTLVDTCTASTVNGEIENKGGGAGVHPSGKISSLTFTGCSHKTTVLANGSLEIQHTSGTNGNVISKGAEVTVLSTTFGVSCIAKTEGGTSIGTLTGVTSGSATMDINGIIPTGFLCGGDSRWKGSYTVTTPTGLNVEAS